MKRKWIWLIPLLALILLAGAFLIYTGNYYHADADALAALISDETVTVSRTSYGWFFDGPSGENALVFYPGAKVEETAYAPLAHLLAREGMDVCLVSMPFRLAFFGADKASAVMGQYAYDHWYIGGHSLGGAMAAAYAADHPDRLTGVILLAAYPTKALDKSLTEISIYGSGDGVLNREKVEAGHAYIPSDFHEYVIEGGNHARFGNYGPQRGDGAAAVTGDEQQRMTVDYIIQIIR